MKIQNDENLISRISGVLSSILSSRSPSGESNTTEQSAGAASFGSLLSGMTVQQRVSFGDWIQEDGTWYRSVTPPHQTRGVSYYADAEGNLYAKSVVPGATMRSVETPDWFSGMMPGNPPVSVSGVSSQGQSSYSYGGTVTIDGKKYTSVTPPGPAISGSQYLIDSDGNWYRLSSSRDTAPKPADAPSWWDGIMPNGASILGASTQGQSSYSYGSTTIIDGKEYTAVTPPGLAISGSQYLIDSDGNWYRLSSARDAEPKAIEAPSWWDRVLPNGETLASISSQGQATYTYGGTTTIDGKEYTAVTPPGPAMSGTQYLIDSDGNWYRLSSAQDATLKPADAPLWWDGILPNSETPAPATSSLEFLRFGPWETIDGTMYRTVWQPGIQNRGGEYLIDRSFSWYYRSSTEGSVPLKIDIPNWFLEA